MADTGRGAATTVAVASVLEHHPGAHVTVVVTDPTARPEAPDGAAVLAARDLDIAGVRYIDAWLLGGPEVARWAVVPAAARAVGLDPDGVLVVPASAWVLGPLDDLTAPATGITLVSRGWHADADVAFGGWLREVAALGSDCGAVLDWWEDAAAAQFEREPDPAMLADPWRAFTSGGGAITAATDPSLRLAPDGADLVALGLDGDRVVTGGAPLRLAQFPGFDPTRPWWYASSPDTEPRLLASESPALRHLGRAYAAALEATGAPIGSDATDTAIGLRPSPELRRVLGAAYRAARREGTVAPNPLDPATATEFFEWFADPAASSVTGISPAADVVWLQRPDLAAVFPHVRWNDRDGFVRWLWTHGLNEGLITTATLPPRTAAPADREDEDHTAVPARVVTAAHPGRRPFGVNLVGYHDAELGLGVAVRRVGAALDAAGIPWTKVTYDRSHSRRRATSSNRADSPYWFNLILVAPDQLAFLADDVGPAFFDDHHNIGLWYWETDAMNARQIDAFSLVDEVWGSTRYLADVFARHSDRPVVHLPVPLEFAAATASPEARARLSIDERFTFLFSFDFLSISQRKNPLGLVDAYCRAFGPDDGCRLILKSINGDLHTDEAEELRDAIADRPDIELWDRYLDGADRIDLVANVDAYVSLHRSEGLGLTMAEAMSAGTPVIATGYSGNLDFMPEGAALLVDHREVEIGPGSFYPADGHWADPDLDHAAELMRRVRDDAELRRDLAAAGLAALAPFTVKRVGAAIDARLRELWR